MKRFALFFIFTLLVCVYGNGAAQAAVYTVSNTNDSGAGSLRQAIGDSEASAGVADTINFDPAFFNVQRTILLTGGALIISQNGGDLTINGPGANLLTIDGNNQSRVFRPSPATIR